MRRIIQISEVTKILQCCWYIKFNVGFFGCFPRAKEDPLAVNCYSSDISSGMWILFHSFIARIIIASFFAVLCVLFRCCDSQVVVLIVESIMIPMINSKLIPVFHTEYLTMHLDWSLFTVGELLLPGCVKALYAFTPSSIPTKNRKFFVAMGADERNLSLGEWKQ